MKKFALFLIWLLLICVSCFAFFGTRLTGAYLEPRLENVLTRLFDMPVTITGLHANVFTGFVRAERIVFSNQPGFTKRPHLNTGISFRIHFLALLDKKVWIDWVQLERPYYLIEKMPDGELTRTNIVMWVRHIKQKKKNSPPKPAGAKKWNVRIHKITIRGGTFIYDNRALKTRRRYVFQYLDGLLEGFEWPSPGPEVLPQKLRLRGHFGWEDPAPFEIEGRANFATSQVGFELDGWVRDGSLMDHKIFWQGLPLKVSDGRFDLKLHLVCMKRALRSDNEIVLKKLKVKPKRSAAMIWGFPLMATISFLESEEAIHLKVPVNGEITDPKFGFTRAFRRAFQGALGRYTGAGVSMLEKQMKRMAHTGSAMVKAPVKMIGPQIGKMTTMVRNVSPIPVNHHEEKS